jgi:hypothetical protein
MADLGQNPSLGGEFFSAGRSGGKNDHFEKGIKIITYLEKEKKALHKTEHADFEQHEEKF